MGSVEKKELRRTYLALRRTFSKEQRKQWDAAIQARILAMPELEQAANVFCFIGTEQEIDTRPLIEAFWQAGKAVYVPRCLDLKGNLSFYRIYSWNDVEEGVFGLLEPKWDCEEWHRTDSILCILPGLCFTKQGHRLGYGKGFYDRFLAKVRAIKVGICYNCCIVEKIPQDQYDQIADWVFTETEPYYTGKSPNIG